MAADILICWPDAEAAHELRQALAEAVKTLQVEAWERYPTEAEIHEAVAAGGVGVRALVVGLTGEEGGLDTLRTAREASNGVLLIAAGVDESAGAIKAAMRADAADYWTPPFEAAELRRALAPLLEADPRKPRGELIAVAPAQPGDGGSTAALHLAHGISKELDQPTLLIDCDIHCGILAFRLGLDPDYSLLDALANAAAADDLWAKLTTPWRGIHTLPASQHPAHREIERLEALPQVLRSALRAYPCVVADLPPALGTALYPALELSSAIYLVATPELSSLHLVRRKLRELTAAGIRREKVRLILNRADSENAVAVEEVEKSVEIQVFATLPNDYRALGEAAMKGRTVQSSSELGRAFRELARRALGRQEEPDETRAGGWRRLLSFG